MGFGFAQVAAPIGTVFFFGNALGVVTIYKLYKTWIEQLTVFQDSDSLQMHLQGQRKGRI